MMAHMERCRHGLLDACCAWCGGKNRAHLEVVRLDGRNGGPVKSDPDRLAWLAEGGEGARRQRWTRAEDAELRKVPLDALPSAARKAELEQLAKVYGRSRSAVAQRWYLLLRRERSHAYGV